MKYFDDGTWFDDFVVNGPDPNDPPARPFGEVYADAVDQRITARRHTAYALAGLQPCDSCGKPGWSIDGTVVIRHEVDVDEDACPGVLARKAALDRAIEQLVGIVAVQPPAPKPMTWEEIHAMASRFRPGNPPSVIGDLHGAYEAIDSAPYRASYPPPAWHRVEVDKVLDGDDLVRDEYQKIMDRYVAELIEQHTAKLDALAAEAAKAGCTLCVHEDREMITDAFELARDEVRLTMRVRYHMIWPGQVCQHVPRTQYGAPVEPGGPPA